MPPIPLITLTTDFGEGSPYIAAMKGVVLALNPTVQIVDVTHAIAPQDIRGGAIILDEITPLYPSGTLHIAVVDPGVGSARALVYAEIGEQRYIGPDNGLFSRLASRLGASKIRAITEERWFRQPVAPTFHGRDIMAPAAAHLSLGVDPDDLGPPHAQLVELVWPGAVKVANRIDGQVTAIDSFGNLITDITREMLAGVPTDETVGIFCDEHETRCIFNAYADQPPMTLIALIGSNDCLELAIVDDSAKIMLGVRVGTPVQVKW
ncbi:SAM hydrolase/SAM-dependent halogenase family protein [Lacipirellula sp.]|uniref:SAM hydrolase/SAM-dependent halogenase family protein n=1 Tax=Lacipirellula sp. TaxID=2691419 RepID=UPI003D115B33